MADIKSLNGYMLKDETARDQIISLQESFDSHNHDSSYETKTDASAKLNEAKSYANDIKNDLLNGAGEAYDTLKELGELIDENHDAIEVLEAVATNKADKEHTHIWNDIEDRPFGENWAVRSKEYVRDASTSTSSIETPPLGYRENMKLFFHEVHVVNVYLNGTLYKSGTIRLNDENSYRIFDSDGVVLSDRAFRLDRTSALYLGYVDVPPLTETTTILVTYEYIELKTLDEKFIPGHLVRSGTGTSAVVLNGGQPEAASGMYSHAEGWEVVASGNHSHAEGYGTVASGFEGSHSEGVCTIAAGKSQHAQGRYNIEDTEDKYSHIVGNGTNDARRSNAHTLDWNGNAWFAGTIKMGGTGQDDLDAVEVASKTDLDALSVEDICTNIERVVLYSGEMLFETPETVIPDRGWFEGTTITCSDTSIYPAESKVAIFFDGKRVIEDRSIFSKDFTIATFDYDVMFIPGESSFNIRVHAKDISSHTVGVYIWYPVFTPIDSKYLPDTVATKTYVDEAVANIDIPEQVQADWSVNDETSPAYIQNKPTEEDALMLLMEMGMIEPAVDADGTILTDENGYVFSY